MMDAIIIAAAAHGSNINLFQVLEYSLVRPKKRRKGLAKVYHAVGGWKNDVFQSVAMYKRMEIQLFQCVTKFHGGNTT